MQSKWWVTDSLNLKKFAIRVVGDNWKDERNKLYLLKSQKGTRPREAVEADVPDGVDPVQWRNYIAWRMGALGRARERRGQQARAQQEVSHSTGSVPHLESSICRTYTFHTDTVSYLEHHCRARKQTPKTDSTPPCIAVTI